MTLFDSVSPRPADALLGLMAAFRADSRDDKVDLGVGIFRNNDGQTPVMNAVRAAEVQLAESATTKAYESPRGNVEFCDGIEKLVLGGNGVPAISAATPGGCGALALAMMLGKRLKSDATVWVSAPTWPNHPHVAKTVGLNVASYQYASPQNADVEFDRMLNDLQAAARGDILLLQGPCHNPTGTDLSDDQWAELGRHCARVGILPLIDIAYHGFARSLEEDLSGVHKFLKENPDALIAYSCSKNFGLYRDRVGALMVTSSNEASLAAVQTHLADIARAVYSMPPAHGPAIVATILNDDALLKSWQSELTEMKNRVQRLRALLAEQLRPQSNSYDPKAITQQNGMFSQLPFVDGGIDLLREQNGIYIPQSGRINVAGLTEQQLPMVATSLSAFV